MSGNYNVDDILAEINAKRQRENSKNEMPVRKISEKREEVPFRLTGMTEEFARLNEEARLKEEAEELKRAELSEKKVNRAKREEPEKEEVREAPSGKMSFFDKFKKEEFDEEYTRPLFNDREKKPFRFSEERGKNYFDEDDLDFTLTMEIDTDSSEKILQYDKGKTVVLPNVREMNKALKEERQEKIREFMANSDFENKLEKDDDFGFSFGDREKDEFKESLGLKGKHSFTEEEQEEAEEQKKKKRKKMKDLDGKETFKDDFDEVEFRSEEDIPEIIDELAHKKKGAVIKLMVTGIVFILLLYLSLSNLFPLPLISAICPENNMKIYLLVNLIIFIVGAMVKNSDIGSGLKAFFTLKANNDSPAAIASLAVIIQGTYAAFKGDYIFTGESHIYFAVAGLILFMNSFGKLLTLNRVQKNFKIASEEKDLTGEYLIENSALAYNLSEGQGFDEANITYGKKVKFPKDFMSLSFSDNYFEQYGKIISPLFVLFGLIISLISFFLFGNSANDALTVFTVVMCMASPLTSTIVSSLPLYKASCALSPEGSFVSGYTSVDKFEETNCILMNAGELYRQDEVILHGIKVFGDMRIDKSLVEAASLMYASDGLLKDVFLDTIEGQLSMLKKVTELKSYNGGISGMCEGSEVIMGSRALMERFSVALPSRDYENKFLKDDRKVIYLSSGGVLSAMIVVTYKPSEDAMDCFDRLKKYAPAIIMKSDDPNINAAKIAKDFDYPEEYISMVEEQYYGMVDKLRRCSDKGKAYAMVSRPDARLRLITAIVSLKKNITVASVLQMAGLILGYAMVALMAFTGNLKMLGFLQIIIYQLFWAICIVVHGSVGRY